MKTEVKSNKPKKSNKKVANRNTSSSKKKKQKKNNIKKAKIIAIVFLTIIACALIAVVIYSDLFNITKITVVNNQKVSSEEIINNSGFSVGNNMFKTMKIISKKNIKTNPYIEEVKISRKLNGEVVINVTERIVTYMLQGENDYAYINNQGYLLEASKEQLQVPIIKGFQKENLIIGNRLSNVDLKKLDTLIQIMETAKNNGIKDKISAIDISDANDFILEIPSEGKTVHFGDEKNINMKVLWIVDLLEREKGIEGEIMLNVSDIKKVYFREKV